MDGFLSSPQTRAHYAPTPGLLNISMDFNAAPSGTARGTEVVIPDDASPEVRAAAERYNREVAAFAARHGIEDYPIRGVRTRSENGRGVSHTMHTEPFFNTDLAMQEAIKNNPAEFAAIYRAAFGTLPDARVIAPHGVGKDRGAASEIFGDETTFGEMIANAALGNDYTLPDLPAAPVVSTSGRPDTVAGGSGTDAIGGGMVGTDGLLQQRREAFRESAERPRTGLLGNPDAMGSIALALGGLSMHPNEAMLSAVRGGMEDRREDRLRQEAQQRQAAASSRASMDAQAKERQQQAFVMGLVEAGKLDPRFAELAQVDPGRAYSMAVDAMFKGPEATDDMREFEAARRGGYEGTFADWMGKTGGGDPSAAEATISRLMEIINPQTNQPYTRQEAIALEELYQVSRDPVTGQATIINKATGAPVGGGDDALPVAPGQSPALSFGSGDRSDAFGAEGILKGAANSISDALGVGLPFEDVSKTQADFAVLRENVLNDIASAYPRQPPSWLLEAIRDTIPEAGTLRGAGRASNELDALRRSMENELALAVRQSQRRQTPTQRAETEARIVGLENAIGRLDGALSSLDPSRGAGGGIPNSFIDGLGDLPPDVTPESVWEHMTPEDRALWLD